MSSTQESGLAGLTVLSFESRRSVEMAELVRRHGGLPIVAPSMREVPLQANAVALDFLRRLDAGEIDVVLFMTGVGTRTLAEALSEAWPPTRFADLLRRVTLVARGPKPVAALREMGLTPNVTAPEPNTWREILETLDREAPVRGKTVAVQEYGVRNPELLAGLEERGARVLPVPVYRWELPEDRGPLHEGLRRLAAAFVDVALFTSANQVEHVLLVANELGLRDAVRAAAARVVFGSVGPICSEQLRKNGLPVDFEPDHPKMGHLVLTAARRARELLSLKRGVHA